MTGNCPKCGEPITKVNCGSIELEEADRTLHGTAYLCPNCNCVVGISMDTLAAITEAVSEVTHSSGKGFGRTHHPGKRATRHN
jgi:TPP-dependent indolepyruvate ferredoxin oxidoreductase alpha subunit